MTIKAAPCVVSLGESFACPVCGTEQPAVGGAWIAAHWQEPLKGECSKCRQQFVITAGVVEVVKTKSRRKRGIGT